MKKVLVLVLIVSVFSVISFAAEIPMGSSFEEKHKDAQYIFLLYSIDIKVNEDWSYVRHVHKKIKILKEEAKSMGEVPIVYLKGNDQISKIKTFTITAQGKKLVPTKIQDLNVNDGDLMYSDTMVKVITLPEVNVGSILDHEYTIQSKGLPMGQAFWDSYSPDPGVSIKELKISITFPKKLNIKYRGFGLSKEPTSIETKTNITYSWVVNDIDGSSDQEAYSPPPTPESFKNAIEFSSIGNWSDFSNWYMSLVNKNLKITPELVRLVSSLIEGKKSIKDKTRAIKEYVQDNFRYVSMSFGNNAMEPHPTDEVFANKYGDCKDLSLLTLAMLKIAGIDSSMALFNNDYEISDPQFDLPVPSLFDHVLLLVKDPKEGDFYLDPLLKDYDLGEYPLDYQQAYTFIINENGGKMDQLPIFSEVVTQTTRKQDITIEADGSDTVIVDSVSSLGDSIDSRNHVKSLDQAGKVRFFEALDNAVAGNGVILEKKIEGLEQRYGPLKYHSIIKRKDDFSLTDDLMIINLDAIESIFEFNSKERKHPIFNPVNHLDEQTIIYHTPKGFDVYYLPKNINLDIGFFSVKREYTHHGNEIKLVQALRLKRGQYPAADYAKIKDFFDKLGGKTQQRIILRKK